jgi:hypothetical protein
MAASPIARAAIDADPRLAAFSQAMSGSLARMQRAEEVGMFKKRHLADFVPRSEILELRVENVGAHVFLEVLAKGGRISMRVRFENGLDRARTARGQAEHMAGVIREEVLSAR